MPDKPATESSDDAMRRFFRRVWKNDVTPLLADKRGQQRAKSARIAGMAAASAGALADGLFRLRGKPFTRAMTVLGTSLGAMLPDIWDWRWFREASDEQKRVVTEQVRRRAAELEDAEALALFGLKPDAPREALRSRWRQISRENHPDRATRDEQRAEYTLRFVAYNEAHQRLCEAYDQGRLPVTARPQRGDLQ
jgi:hypothetical protein